MWHGVVYSRTTENQIVAGVLPPRPPEGVRGRGAHAGMGNPGADVRRLGGGTILTRPRVANCDRATSTTRRRPINIRRARHSGSSGWPSVDQASVSTSFRNATSPAK